MAFLSNLRKTVAAGSTFIRETQKVKRLQKQIKARKAESAVVRSFNAGEKLNTLQGRQLAASIARRGS